ncbi:MAG TPA: hypothetical protein VJ964_11895 [Balneolaceae bacterium]|nr:hypothetical protein [Balneolaceae bacterium]
MLWVAFLLTVVSGYATLKLIGLTQNRGRLKFLGLTIAASIFFVMELSVFLKLVVVNPAFVTASNFIVEWGQVLCLAFILSSLAIFIRESKPVFAQFPMLYTGLPLLIVISYFLVKDTYALKKWLLMIYQGGAITVAIFMYAIYTYRKSEYTLVLLGTCFFLLSYLLFWYVPGIKENYGWIWRLTIVAGIITTIIGYEKTELELDANVPVNESSI